MAAKLNDDNSKITFEYMNDPRPKNNTKQTTNKINATAIILSMFLLAAISIALESVRRGGLPT
tara:strand:- start:105 stop:293 length:189 start_codon:yes stop_codon:yes gene_type:complete